MKVNSPAIKQQTLYPAKSNAITYFWRDIKISFPTAEKNRYIFISLQ